MDMSFCNEQFLNLTLCMSDVGFSVKDRTDIFRILAAILHIGNVEFDEGEDSFAKLKGGADTVRHVAGLLGVGKDDFTFTLESYNVKMRGRLQHAFQFATHPNLQRARIQMHNLQHVGVSWMCTREQSPALLM
jgi:myosin heavy subunit